MPLPSPSTSPRLDAGSVQVVVVDVQTQLVRAMAEDAWQRCAASLGLLGTAARALGLPTTITEHVPERIGPTIEALQAVFEDASTIRKVHFSAADEPALLERIGRFDRPQLVVAGMETHVCVLQTALGLSQAGFTVHIATDACCARFAIDAELALERAKAHGIGLVTTEMVAFEGLRRADHPARRKVIEAVKARSEVWAQPHRG